MSSDAKPCTLCGSYGGGAEVAHCFRAARGAPLRRFRTIERPSTSGASSAGASGHDLLVGRRPAPSAAAATFSPKSDEAPLLALTSLDRATTSQIPRWVGRDL